MSTSNGARHLIAISGHWQFEGTRATYTGGKADAPAGLSLAATRFRSGRLGANVCLSSPEATARLVFGYNAATRGYYSIGVGGHDSAYVLVEFVPGRGWVPLERLGEASQIRSATPYQLAAEISGQVVSFTVDGVKVFEHELSAPVRGDQVGLFASGASDVTFEDFRLSGRKPRIFVVMQFGEPYDNLYREVLQPVSARMDFEALRADDMARPGIILQDIVRGIAESDVIVAEITPVNANVFYELGYAHALQKPTILLANRKTEKLPFDISSYRTIFYDDTISGKTSIEELFAKYLLGIREGRQSFRAASE